MIVIQSFNYSVQGKEVDISYGDSSVKAIVINNNDGLRQLIPEIRMVDRV